MIWISVCYFKWKMLFLKFLWFYIYFTILQFQITDYDNINIWISNSIQVLDI